MNLSRVFLVAAIIINYCNVSSQTVVERHGKLHIEGSKIKDECGRIVQLKGMSFFHHIWENSYNYQNNDVYNWLKTDWNVQILRIPIAANQGSTGYSYFEDSTFALNIARNAINAAINAGLYIIVDWHVHDIYTPEAKRFFTTLASEYPDTPNIIWEIFNEPTNQQTWPEIKSYSEKIIATIRTYSQDNIIVIGTPTWSSAPNEVISDPILTDSTGTSVSNIAYAQHFYAAFHKDNVREQGTQAINAGLCVFVTECGSVDNTAQGEDDYESWNKWVDWMDRNDISWCKWSLSIKDEPASALLPTAGTSGNWNVNSDLTEAGRYIRNYFKTTNELPVECVDYVPATGIEIINCPEDTIIVGDTIVLSTEVIPNNATYKEVIWSTSFDTRVSINENGKIEGLNTGSAIIKASIRREDIDTTCTVVVKLPSGITFQTSNKVKNYKIFPNPSDGSTKIFGDGEFDIAIVDMQGRLVYKKHVHINDNSVVVTGLSKGVYYVLFNSDGSTVRKLVIQ